ncbi:hypothetical protein Taro_042530 [Colocasia esculenta]|uniref:Uncharacterized protein n=1 Tax=Colocasia esculenta TaxID=4460 RepID=A0A843WYR5_COLES|nr:hypothetical protein [Colocasia esculenta]
MHHSCRQVLLETGFQNHVGCWNPGFVDRQPGAVDRRALSVDRYTSSVDRYYFLSAPRNMVVAVMSIYRHMASWLSTDFVACLVL